MPKPNKNGAKKEAGETLTINEAFAKKYDEEQSKAAFSRKDKKGARQSEFDRLKAEMELAEEEAEGDEGDSEEEDDEGQLLTPQVDRAINETLAAIRKKDQDFLRKATPVIVEGQLGKSAKNSSSVKSVLAKQIMEESSSDEEESPKLPETSVVTQMKIKREFLSEAKKADDEDEDSDDLFTIKPKTAEELEKEAAETAEGKKALESFFKKDELSADDAFMKNYLGQQWWKETDLSKLPSYKDITGEDPFEQPDDSEDEGVLDAQDNFESKYNFRFQEGGASAVVSHPRHVEDTVRQTTSKRKRQRESKAERLKEEKLRREEELKRLKSLKKKEIQDKVNMLKVITGTGSKGIDASHLRLDRPFNPEEHDRMMSEMFDNEYYQEEDDAIRDAEIRAEIVGADEDDLDIKPGKFLRADVNKVKKLTKQQKRKNKKAAKQESETFGGDFGIEEAELDESSRLEAERVKQELDAKIKELENLDFEDVIGGNIKCHFHYREVQSKDFGMTTEEILNASDKELNQMASIKKLAPFRPDANSNTPWWEMKGKRKTKAAKLMREKKRLERQGIIAQPESKLPYQPAGAVTPTAKAADTVATKELSDTAPRKKRKHSEKTKTVVPIPAPSPSGKPSSAAPAAESKAARRRARQKKLAGLQLQEVWGKNGESNTND